MGHAFSPPSPVIGQSHPRVSFVVGEKFSSNGSLVVRDLPSYFVPTSLPFFLPLFGLLGISSPSCIPGLSRAFLCIQVLNTQTLFDPMSGVSLQGIEFSFFNSYHRLFSYLKGHRYWL